MLRCVFRGLSTSGVWRTTTVVNSIPPRVHLDYADQTYAYILSPEKTLDDLAGEIKDNHSEMRTVSFWDGNKECSPSTPIPIAFMRELNIRLNNELVRVYPNINFVFSGDVKVMKRCLDSGIAVNDSRVIAKFVSMLKEKLKPTFTDLELKAAIEQSFLELEETMQDEEKLLKEKQEGLKGELETIRSQRDALLQAAHAYADNVMKIGLGTLVAQFSIIGYGTFGLYGWDVMEPVSYMFGLSWTWLGYSYFLARKQDYESGDFHAFLVKRRFDKLKKGAKIDEEQIKLLETKIQEISEHLYNLR